MVLTDLPAFLLWAGLFVLANAPKQNTREKINFSMLGLSCLSKYTFSVIKPFLGCFLSFEIMQRHFV